MLKDSLLYLAQQDSIRSFISTNGAARRAARRFVAGESLDEALAVAQSLNSQGISVSLDHLGENVADVAEAHAATADYIEILNRIAHVGADANISVKLTALGLDIAEHLCRDNLIEVLHCAATQGAFVRIDMEGSAYTERTIAMTLSLRATFDNVGTVVQSMLYRTPKDVEMLIASRTRVRLVKGAYLEPPSIAYPRKADVNAQYIALMHRLLEDGTYPAIATHDERMIEEAQRFAKEHSIGPERFEFQMLYGIRRDLQERLAREGYNVRVYVPYGSQWYPYLTRRMAERPANMLFVVNNAFRG